MTVLYVVLAIYTLGVIFTIFAAMYAFTDLVTKDWFSIKLVTQFPKFLLLVLGASLAWPFLLFLESSFRAEVIDCSGIFLPFGYTACIFGMFIYPWVWVWYISYVIAWCILRSYHYRVSPEEKIMF